MLQERLGRKKVDGMLQEMSGQSAGWERDSMMEAPTEPPLSTDTDVMWYAVIDGSQVGPMALSGLERQWEDEEIGADTLVWKPGMVDWVAVADLPELASWITEKPQGMLGGAVSFGPNAGAASAREILWRSSAAKDLATLVAEEMGMHEQQSQLRALESPQTPVGFPAMAIPGLGGVHLFAPAGQARSSTEPLGFSAMYGSHRSFSQPFGALPANTQGWVVPAPFSKERKGMGILGVIAVIGILGLVMAALGATVWVGLSSRIF